MNGLELLKKYPKAAEVIKDWYLKKMVESFNSSGVPELPEDFINSFKEVELKNEDVAPLINSNPSVFFQLLDELDILIQINVGSVFSYEINKDQVIAGAWNTRKEAEYKALEQALEILNKQLEQ